MRPAKFMIFIVLFSLVFLGFALSRAQENTTNQEMPATPPQAMDVQWLWGEVVSLDPQNNALVVKYLDYETDTEKQLTIAVDKTRPLKQRPHWRT